MDKLKDMENEAQKSERKISFSLPGSFAEGDRRALVYNLIIFAVSLVFSRCHVVFGAHPLGIMTVALLPSCVWISMLGSAIGYISLGGEGIIYALAMALTVFLRVVISGGQNKSSMFSEGILARGAVAVVGGFVTSLYEVIATGFSLESVLFSVAMILIPPAALFLLSGLFSLGFDLEDVIFGERNIFSLRGVSDEEKYNAVFFALSSLALLFLVSLSLFEFEFFGVSLSYIFISFVTLIAAKRFGPYRALVVGFVSSLGVSGVYSVSFALAGLGAGFLFKMGSFYAFVVGGALLSAWSAYSGGLVGFLATLPEYGIAAALVAPLTKSFPTEKTPAESVKTEESAKEMVGAMALKYQSERGRALDSLVVSLSSISALIEGYAEAHMPLSTEEYRNTVIDVADGYCRRCSGMKLCMAEDIRPCIKRASEIAEKLSRGEIIRAEDVNSATEFCQHAEEVAAAIMREAARAERENHKLKDSDSTAEEYELIARLVSEARAEDELERCADETLTEPLYEVARNFGFEDGVIRAFGVRRKHFILAGEDEDGSKISSPELKLGIENATGVRLSKQEFFKNGKYALMECDARRAYAVECASGKVAGDEREICGDSVALFESSDDRFFAVLSDGMGRGEVARDTSEFVVSFLERALDFGASKDTVLQLLNNAMRRRCEECSATVDIFELDLLSGEGVFIKSGSAPSFVKRDSSIFRIKSGTAPIGLMKGIDSEKIRVEIKGEDYVIMLSDGILQTAEESPWLLELLSKPAKRNLKEYVDLILTEATKNSRSRDDMSVIVLKISKI